MAPAVLALSLVTPPAARAQLSWDSPRARSEEAAAAVALGIGALVLNSRPSPASATFRGGLLLDDSVRALRADTIEGRTTAADASDVLQWVSVLVPVLIDPVLVAWAIRGSGDVALQMLAIDALSLATAAFAITLSKHFYGRERPFARGCDADAGYHPDCENARRFRSLASAHVVVTATGAGLVCAHHRALPLYGGGPADAIACTGAVAVAVATGILRIVADEHWATDVLVSAMLGAIAGYVLPVLLHYGVSSPER